ncbi:MAG: histidinol dehydrogenase [Hyphomicrobiaceae bacterium]|nr:histidinol dehydrogenase [Hyphomicrobiaceae bacterium]
MVRRLYGSQANFETYFADFLSIKREESTGVSRDVHAIITDVSERGDQALFDYSQKFDQYRLESEKLAVSEEDIHDAVTICTPETIEALQFASKRIQTYHERQKPDNNRYNDELNVSFECRWTAIQSAGLYVPGGSASYPSSVLMNAIPAKVAGVKRLVMVVPTPKGQLNPLVLAAAQIVGINEIYRVGGAHAVAALAYGTETIKPVVKIFGPGNSYVAEAKRQVFGICGIDSIAGPSEILVIADSDNDPSWIAADLLAQAEHDTTAQSVLITDSISFADKVEIAVNQQLKDLPRYEIAAESWLRFGAIITLTSLDQAPRLANQIAAEHLEILTSNSNEIAAQITNAGAIFLGRYTPEVIGDYVAGSNHVLPTLRSARFSSGLGVTDFMKRTSLLKLTPDAISSLAPHAITLARAEGLEAHCKSAELRLLELSKKKLT